MGKIKKTIFFQLQQTITIFANKNMATMKRNILDIARYTGLNLLQKGLSVSPLKLQKILYYEQAWYMVFFNKQHLFEDVPEAWVNGPVYRSVYDKYKGKTAYMNSDLNVSAFLEGEPGKEEAIKKLAKSMNLQSNEIDFLESVFNTYGTKSQGQLVYLTHAEKPWAEQREGLLPFEHSNKKISLESMFQYYNERYQRRKRKNNVSE